MYVIYSTVVLIKLTIRNQSALSSYVVFYSNCKNKKNIYFTKDRNRLLKKGQYDFWTIRSLIDYNATANM